MNVSVSHVIAPWSTGSCVWEFWGSDDEHYPCAFMSCYVESQRGELIIIGLEVRPGWRGHGLGAKFIQAVQDYSGVPVRGDGFFTPKGWRSLQGVVAVVAVPEKPLVPGRSFVHSWDRLEALHV